ncbi:FAD binding domain protein [Aspergillus nomiae NRRL 13137]|uniref:Delta(24)-sterol reductase n=1 Tax=Aspergillus nomiae NRRL (strain ATCC 15546 / NRRL 13137 / CBS 260.88 / M93) TaxID=1509407 RepID=A0A0L1J9F9_ASPN3|nr:FAD binding domain protein [Aspergillus nomiae NRRL 13137]KNG88053.1 FAD binding domain protein [Aspergillus nomiae NRRL 13137]
MDFHSSATADIAAAVRRFHELKKPFRIYHGSTSSTRQRRTDHSNVVDISGLNNILSIDESRMTVLVEPNVPMDMLARHTLKHNLIPLVVMEFRGITAGGGFSGTSGESSSFKYGFFDRTVNFIEIILGNGERVTASRTEEPDLFWGAASSFGTMGVVTLLEIQLRYVGPNPHLELEYLFTNNMEEALAKMQSSVLDPNLEYLDGIVFSKEEILICKGRIAQNKGSDYPTHRFTRPEDEWFYIHAQSRMQEAKLSENAIVDYIPLEDYLFRYDRGAFWGGKYSYEYFFVPFTRWTRWLFDTCMGTRMMYHALHESGLANQYIVQDVGIPYDKASEFVDWLDSKETFGHYPLWLCPLRVQSAGEGGGLLTAKRDTATTDTSDTADEDFLMNFGIWGPGPTDRRRFIDRNRRLEQKVHSLGGKKWLYAHTYYTEDEFWSIYDRKSYDALRGRYHAKNLPSLYEKVRVELESPSASWSEWFWSIRPFAGWYGAWKAISGGDYLMRSS